MADAGDNAVELLFFDTFSHENTEELNLDLVQFPHPVIIYEVRVIPLRAQVQANLAGGVRLGATNPSSFKLELFVNNLTRPSAATFEKLGLLDYKENTNIQLKPEAEVPTDGLVLKGWYNTVTVAIYGCITSAKPAKASPPPPPPPRKVQEPRSHDARHEPAMTEEELCKSAPGTQHPLDFIQHKLQQLQQRYTPRSSTPPGPSPSAATATSAAAKPTPPHPSQGTSSSQDIFKPFEQLLQPHTSRDREVNEQREPKRDYTFPPEPKEPYEARDRERGEPSRDAHEETRSRDSREDWEYRRERRGSGDSRDSREYAGSREGSQDSRDFREKERDRYRDREELERERERELEREMERGREQWEREREREREREKELEREREREREQREREKREREQREREQREREQREREQREREAWERERERERVEEQEREKAQKQREKAWEPARPHTPPMPEAAAGSPERSQSRSRSRSPLVHDSRPPEPPMPPEEEMEVAETEPEEAPGEVEMYENLSENSPHVEVAVEPEGAQEEEDGYEDISSDDELNDGEETELIRQHNLGFPEDLTEDTWSFSSSMFNPLQCYLVPLAMFKDPSMTAYEMEMCSYNQMTEEEKQRPAEAQSILTIMEQFSKAEHTDKWVTALEAVPPSLNKGLSYLLHVDKKKRVLDTLLEWTLEGLSEDQAMKQPEATFKIRHLKMGISLASALLSCDPSITLMLVSADIQSKLVDLLESRCMAFSIRLLILKALDNSLRFANGVRWFLGSHPQQSKKRDKGEISAYHRMVQLMSKKQLAQVMMGMNSLLRKAHTYETFMKLRAAIDHVLDSLPSAEEEEPGPKVTGGGGEEGEEEMEHPESSLPVAEEDVDTIVACLEEIHRLFAQPQYLIAQPKSLLPVKTLSEKSAVKPADVYPSLFRLAYHCRLLECLFVLLSMGTTASQASIFVGTRRVIQTLLQSQEGLLFLSTRPDTTNGIIRSLVQMTQLLQDETCEESGEDMVARQLGLEMVYHLHTLQHVDQLLEYQKKVGDLLPVDDAEPLSILHSLYSMTFTSGLRDCVMGRRAIAHVLGLANNFSALLPFIQPSGDEAKDAAQRKSVCWDYTTQLVTMVIMNAEGTEIIEKYGSRLLTISEDGTNTGKLTQLQEWLAPVKKLSAFSVEEVGTMASLLKANAEDVSKMPPSLITVLRLLHNLAIPPQYLTSLDDEFPTPLHHNYVLVELYSADCFPVFVNILQKLSEAQLKPWQQGVPQSLDHWTMFFAAIVPALAIVRATISLIIHTRGSEFKDMTVLSTLLELHTVVCSVPSSTLYNAETLKVQKDIVDTLLAFTQPEFKSQGEEALSSSMWTLMMKEVIRYAVKSPYVYMSGLLLISELVPLPFPLLAKDPLEAEEISLAVNTRKLWSAHLHPLMPDIHNLISLLAGTGCQPLLCLLRRVCWQIADLAAPSATIIARCLLDVYLEQREQEGSSEEDKKEGEKEKESKEEGEPGKVSPMTTKILSLVSYLLSQPGIKSAILQLISAGSPEEKYKTLLLSLVQTMNHVSSHPQHVQAQEAIVSVLQSLCDQEITLVAQDTTMSLPEQLTCTLPDKELMSQIVAALLEHISNPSHSYASLLPCVRTLVMLTEHDYGFYHLKVGLESSPGALASILRHINHTFSKDSSDCLSTLSTILELLRLLTTSDSPHQHQDEGEDAMLTRTRTLTPLQLAHILEWAPNRHHPLQDLEAMAKEEEALESLSESISLVMSLLRDSSSHSGTGMDQWEVTLPPSISLLELFTQRSVYTLTDSDDDRLSANCWLANPALEEPDAEPEVVKRDLLAWCQRYLPDLQIEEELKKETEDRQEDIVRPKRPRDRRKSQEVININRGRPGKKPFVAPMRGRGIMAQSMVQRGGHDLFRSRPPNTSRPPSMHVDDFVKMENTRNQMQPPLQPTPPGPAMPRRDKQEMPRGRGRGGIDRGGGRGGFTTRGHFFTPPADYPRRDSNPHGGHNLHLFASAPSLLGSHRPKQNFPAPRQFSHEGGPSAPRHDPHPGGGLLDRHDGRENRFPPRGGRGPWFGGQSKDMGPGRFMRGGGGSGGGFHGRRDADRHQRSFTK